jgi:hypothetical protein
MRKRNHGMIIEKLNKHLARVKQGYVRWSSLFGEYLGPLRSEKNMKKIEEGGHCERKRKKEGRRKIK